MPTPRRVAIATCRDHPGFCAGDDEALIRALGTVGIEGVPAVWDDPAVDWRAFDACLVRTTWDYTQRLDEFMAWLRATERTVPTFNGSALAAPNLDKSYLLDLAARGVPVVPTVWLARGGLDVAQTARERSWSQVAVKPAIGAGAEGLLIASADDADALRAHVALLHERCDAFVQPLVESVRTRGELSLVFIDGAYTHAVRKVPADGEHRVQIEFGGVYTLEDPTERALDVAARSLAGWGETPLYARVDLVEVAPGDPRVIEVELVEPELFFPWAPRAGARLGEALLARLGWASTIGG